MESTPAARARVGYEAYAKTTDGKNFRGDPMPTWEALPDKQREAWINAGQAIANHEAGLPPVLGGA